GNGRVTQRTDSLGGTLTSTYDDAGRLTSRKFSGTDGAGTALRFDLGYSNRDELTSVTRYSDLAGTSVVGTTSFGLDDASRVTSITHKNGSAATLSYYNYNYDSANRVTTQVYSSTVGTATYAGTLAYTYDSTNQLLTDGTATYAYDANGNRTMAGYQ